MTLPSVSCTWLMGFEDLNSEGLNGVGVDGVGGILPFFVYLCFSPLFFSFVFLLFSLEQTMAIYSENGEFHSDPVCTDPVQNFQTKVHSACSRSCATACKILFLPDVYPPWGVSIS